MASSLAQAADFQKFLEHITSLPDSQRTRAVERFLSEVSTWPLVEGDSTAHFLVRAAASSVTLACDANGWNPALDSMERIGGTDFWYFTHQYEPDARLDYKFVLDGTRWILDTLNPHQVLGGFGPNSELRMPAYVPPPEIQPYPDIPHGEVLDTAIASAALDTVRRIGIYTPPGYAPAQDSLPVVIFQDGLEYITLGMVRNVLDYMISQKRILPVIGVFVPPGNRTQEYAGSQMNAYSQFVTQELLPEIQGRYRTRTDPRYRALIGASNGGNISLWIAQHHPEVFGNVAAQSSNVTSAVQTFFQQKPRLDLKVYLDLGTYDIPQLLPLARTLAATLREKGYGISYREYHEGHSWGNWRARLGPILEYFFPR